MMLLLLVVFFMWAVAHGAKLIIQVPLCIQQAEAMNLFCPHRICAWISFVLIRYVLFNFEHSRSMLLCCKGAFIQQERVERWKVFSCSVVFWGSGYADPRLGSVILIVWVVILIFCSGAYRIWSFSNIFFYRNLGFWCRYIIVQL